MAEKLTDRQLEAISLAVYVTLTLAGLALIAYMALPGFKARLRESGQWSRYYRWQIRWRAQIGRAHV